MNEKKNFNLLKFKLTSACLVIYSSILGLKKNLNNRNREENWNERLI